MADPYVTFPGTAGNYASRADTNLLDADTAHTYQSTGYWGNSQATDVFTQVEAPATLAGTFSGKAAEWNVLAGQTGAGKFIRTNLPGQVIAVQPSTVYSFEVKVHADASLTNGAGSTVEGKLYWLDAAGAYLSEDSGVAGAVVDGFNTVEILGKTSDPLAAFVSVGANFAIATTSQAGTVYLADACLAEGSDAEFVPSLRIVGDIDIRAKAAPVTYAKVQSLTGRWESTGALGSWRFGLNATGAGRMELRVTADGTTQTTLQDSGSAWQPPDGVTAEMKVEYVVDSGSGDYSCKFYADGVQTGIERTGTSIGPTFVGGSSLQVGIYDADVNAGQTPFDGDFYTAELRDGIDGPIVAQFRAQDLIGAVPL